MKNQLKKKMRALLVAGVTALAVCCTGCGAKKVSITFMNGEKELGKIEVAEGKTASGYEQFEEGEDLKFEGWYKTPTYLESSKLDLSKEEFNEDTTVYGNFKQANVKEDTRVWTIAGTGTSAALALSNWDNTCEDSLITFTKAADENKFELNVDLKKGDQFQIIADHKWDDQKGYGCVTALENDEFENGGGLSGDSAKANINVIKDGNYTITLTTNPENAAQDTVTIVRNGDAK